MASKKPPPVLTGTVVENVTPVEFTPARLLDLAAAWDREAASLDRRAGAAWDQADAFEDFALALVGGTAAQLRADTLRDCAQALRALVGRTAG